MVLEIAINHRGKMAAPEIADLVFRRDEVVAGVPVRRRRKRRGRRRAPGPQAGDVV